MPNTFPTDVKRLAISGALVIALAAPAAANDATAEIGVGGLQMVYNSAVEVVSEDLFISADEIRVAYIFRNITEESQTVTVAFPLPPLDTTYQEIWVDLPDFESENYVDFEVVVNGKAITPSVYSRVSALGVDRTELLRSAGLPLNPLSFGVGEAISNLPAATLQELRRAGLVAVEPWGTLPTWSLETTFYWEMTFPAGQEVTVEHRYEPVVGYGFFGTFGLEDEWYLDRYCIDESFAAAAQRMIEASDPEFGIADEQRIRYLLTPAQNWASPIGTFHLTVDKGSENALVSFCGTGVTKTGPTVFELTYTDYWPEQELDILIIDPIDQ